MFLSREKIVPPITTQETKYRIYCDLAYDAFEKGMIEKANEFAEKASAIDCSGADPYCVMAKIAAHKKNFKDALTWIEKAIDLDPDLDFYLEVRDQINILKKNFNLEEKNRLNAKSNDEGLTKKKKKRGKRKKKKKKSSQKQNSSLLNSFASIEDRCKNYVSRLKVFVVSLNNSNQFDELDYIFSEANVLFDLFKETDVINLIKKAIFEVGLAFASKSESQNLKDKIESYTYALRLYRLINSPTHIAAACHHLADSYEKLYQCTPSSLNKLCKSYFFYKQALKWYQESLLHIPIENQEYNDNTIHIYDVTRDIQELEDRNLSLVTTVRDYSGVFYHQQKTSDFAISDQNDEKLCKEPEKLKPGSISHI